MKHLLTAIACFFALSMSAQTWNPDADFDNSITVEDLMALLSVFGTEWTAEYPQDPEYELAAYYAGILDYGSCVRACTNNHAKIIGLHEYAMFQDSIEAIRDGGDDFHLDDPRGFFKAEANSTESGIILIGGTTSGVILNTTSTPHCFCTGLVPAVE
jgi:hypothetical protein